MLALWYKCFLHVDLKEHTPWDANGKAKSRNIRIGYIIIPPVIIQSGSPPIGIDADVVETLAAKLNFRTAYVQGGSFNNLAKIVGANLTDISVSQGGLTVTRQSWGGRCLHIRFKNIQFAIRHPIKVDSFYTITYPFSAAVWMAVLGTVIVLAVLLPVMNW